MSKLILFKLNQNKWTKISKNHGVFGGKVYKSKVDYNKISQRVGEKNIEISRKLTILTFCETAWGHFKKLRITLHLSLDGKNN